MDLIDIEAFRASAKGGARPEASILRTTTATPVPATDGSRVIRFCFSDGTVDRSGDSINPKGWDTSAFEANPVALWAHTSWDPPIGRASNLAVEGKRLMGDIEFADAEIYDFADTVYRLVKGRYLNAVSVGFIPREWSFVSEADRPFGIDFTKQELLEISVCPVPCNPNALLEARSTGIDTSALVGWAEKVLDGGGSVMIPKAELEALRAAARTEGAPVTVEIKAGRTISAATRKALNDALGHHDAMGKCIKGLLESPDDTSADDDQDDPDNSDEEIASDHLTDPPEDKQADAKAEALARLRMYRLTQP